MLRSSYKMDAMNISVSRTIALRSFALNVGNSFPSGEIKSILGSCSHCIAKFSTSDAARGSLNIRWTCESRLAVSFRSSASCNSVSSGIELQRK
jgi:hypothetical protein